MEIYLPHVTIIRRDEFTVEVINANTATKGSFGSSGSVKEGVGKALQYFQISEDQKTELEELQKRGEQLGWNENALVEEFPKNWWVTPDGLTTQVLLEFAKEILATIPKPHTEDIIEDAFVAIEANPEWKKRYDDFVSKMKKGVPNQWIGRYIQRLDGRPALQEVAATRSKLIGNYSKLGRR